MSQGELFPGQSYEELPEESFGEHPDLTPEQVERGIENYARVLGRSILIGEITAVDAYCALSDYKETEDARAKRNED